MSAEENKHKEHRNKFKILMKTKKKNKHEYKFMTTTWKQFIVENVNMPR